MHMHMHVQLKLDELKGIVSYFPNCCVGLQSFRQLHCRFEAGLTVKQTLLMM
jgi:hypothetical protein